MPADEKLEEFWIDFNLGSHSISFYFSLADEEAQVSGNISRESMTVNTVYDQQETYTCCSLWCIVVSPSCRKASGKQYVFMRMKFNASLLQVIKGQKQMLLEEH